VQHKRVLKQLTVAEFTHSAGWLVGWARFNVPLDTV